MVVFAGVRLGKRNMQAGCREEMLEGFFIVIIFKLKNP